MVALTAHPCPTSAPLFVPMVNMSLVPLKAMLCYYVSLMVLRKEQQTGDATGYFRVSQESASYPA